MKLIWLRGAVERGLKRGMGPNDAAKRHQEANNNMYKQAKVHGATSSSSFWPGKRL